MNARSGRPIRELAALYELVPLMTYPGWEDDVRSAEANWVDGSSTAKELKWTVDKMRRKQRLHEGDRSDAVLQVLDGATQGLTYPELEQDVEVAKSKWVYGFSSAKELKWTVDKMRRKQRLHDSDKGLGGRERVCESHTWSVTCDEGAGSTES